MFAIDAAEERFGFSAKQTGGHMARSMMLDELRLLFDAVPPTATRKEYQRAIVDENALGKPTASSRDKSYRHLVELYGLEKSTALFRALRQLAIQDPASIPLMGMVVTFCRDAQLRHSFGLIDHMRSGKVLPRERMEQHLETGFPGRFSAAMKKSLAQNVNTTWTYAGHLGGKSTKVRALPKPREAATTLAMLAGYLLGLRGQLLLESEFARLVVQDPGVVTTHLAKASSRGLLRFRHAGGVTEVDFSPMLTPNEQEWLHGAH